MSKRLMIGLGLFVAAVVGINLAVRAEEPDMNSLSPPPIMAHGVSQCGEIVALWVLKLDSDGQIRTYRTDVFHHPDSPEEYNAFLQWVKRTPKEQLDMFELPCTDKKAK